MQNQRFKIPFSILLALLLLFPSLSAFAQSPGNDVNDGNDVNGVAVVRYVAVGDSITTGVRYYFWILPFPARYWTYAQTELRRLSPWLFVLLNNQGKDGITSTQLLQRLQSDMTLRAQLAQAQVITWQTGGNDLKDARELYKKGLCGGADNQECLRNTLATVESNLLQIQAVLLALRAGKPTALRTLDYYNPFVAIDRVANSYTDGPVCAGHECSDLEVFDMYTAAANAFINGTICGDNAHSGAWSYCAQVHEAFNGAAGANDPKSAGLVTVLDGIHPTNYGHAVIAQRLGCLGLQPLVAGAPAPLCAVTASAGDEYEVTVQVMLPIVHQQDQ